MAECHLSYGLDSAVLSFLALFSETLVMFACYGYICGATGPFTRTTVTAPLVTRPGCIPPSGAPSNRSFPPITVLAFFA